MRAGAAIAAMALALGCGSSVPGVDAASVDAASAVRRVTITDDVFGTPGPGLRLSDGATLPAGSGDVWIQQRSIVSLFVASPIGICDVGTFASLEAVPTDASACPGAPGDSVVLSGNTNGTDQWVGRSFLFFSDASATAASYRARIVSDSDVNPAIALTLEYEPLGASL